MIKSYLTTIDEFQIWMSTLGPVVALDFETTDLNYVDMQFVGFSLCDGDRAMYTDNPKLLIYLASFFGSRTWVMHNSVFDLKCCNKFCDDTPEKSFCTLTAAKLINENASSHSLKYLAERILKVPADQIKKYDEICDDTSSKEFIDYGMNDAIWTYQLYQYLSHRLTDEDLNYITGIEMDFQHVLAAMEINGVLVDKTKMEGFQNECGTILFNIESNLLSIFGVCHDISYNLFGEECCCSPINFGSTNQLLNCVETLGFVVDEKTPKGNPSVGAKYLKKMVGKHEFFDLLWRYRKLQKLNNAFLTPLDGFVDSDGRIRPSYNMVRTGRLSCSKPNLQQLPNPKKEKLEFNHRELFIPADGNVIIKADYSGQELRVLGEVSDDTTMVSAFQNDRDLHLTTANHIFDLRLSVVALTDGKREHEDAVTKYKKQRHQAKNGVNFPIVYGATSGRIAGDNKVSKDEAERWLEGFFELYPGVKEAIDKIPEELKKNGYVRTLFGRKRRFPQYSKLNYYEPNYKQYRQNQVEMKGMERQAFNMKIQGSSADIGKIAGISLLKELPSYAKIILFIHDEWIVETPKEHAEEVKKIMVDCLENAVALKVRMAVEAKIVLNFGE